MNSKGQITIKFPDEDVWEEWISFCKKNGKRHGVYGGVLLQRAVVKYMNKEKRLQIIEENKERNLLGFLHE